MNFSGNYAVEFRVFDNGIAYRFVTDKKGDNIVMGKTSLLTFQPIIKLISPNRMALKPHTNAHILM